MLNFYRIALLIIVALLLIKCKHEESIIHPPSKPVAESPQTPCGMFTNNLSKDTLAFVAKTTSKTKEQAIHKAENETTIQLVQFFQDEFIEGGQSHMFGNSGTGQNDDFQKHWAVVSYEIIGREHNHNAFTHNQKILEDSSETFTAYDVLVISDDWIHEHWKKSLAAADSSFYKMAIRKNYDDEIMNMDIRQQPPCKNF